MKIVLVGAGGYGQVYLRTLEKELKLTNDLCAVVDPYAAASEYYEKIVGWGVPIFDTLGEFYKTSPADLVIVSSPIQFHEEQTVAALEHGSSVLCEKPVAATVAQALNMRTAAEKSGAKLGVGFQWSFSDRMRAFKRDIISGKFGAPVCLKAFLYWPREDSYYDSGNWKGRRKTADGRQVNDSVVSNATSHYLHNIFYVLGDTMETSAMPETFAGAVFRLRDIESFDTCFIRGRFQGGARFYYFATHACGEEDTTIFEYEFEKCTAHIDGHMNIFIKWRSGYIDSYANVPDNGLEGKVSCMIDSVNTGAPPRCGIDTVLPHLMVTNSLFERFPTQDFPDDILYKTAGPAGVGVRGLFAAAKECYEKELLPDELEGFPFAAAASTEIINI